MSGDAGQRFRLTIAYDGRPYSGWQSQAGGNTIQDMLLAALREIAPAISTVQGSGRTDAGVSAEGQVAHYDAPADSTMDARAWLRALNTRLPPTIRIMDAEAVSPEFHARFSAVEKTYRYRIWTGAVLPPLQAGLAWHLAGFEKMEPAFREGLALFAGTHDFRAFSANRGDGRDAERETTRTVSRIQLERKESRWDVTLTGNGFLYKMVRFLVGSAAWFARGKLTAEAVAVLLEGNAESRKAPFCAPPDGLSLVKVRYST